MSTTNAFGALTTDVLLAIATLSFAIGAIASLYSTWAEAETAHRSGAVISLLLVFLLTLGWIGATVLNVVRVPQQATIVLPGAAAIIAAGVIAYRVRQGDLGWRLVSALGLFTGSLALVLFSYVN